MDYIDIVSRVFKITFINVLIFFIVTKIINYKGNNLKKRLIIGIISIIEAIIEITLVQYIPTIFVLIIMYILHGLVISITLKLQKPYSILITFIALSISYLLYVISIVESSIVVKMINSHIQENNVIILLNGCLIEIIALSFLFKMKRFKNGIPFLKNEEKVNNIGIIGVIFIGIVLIIYSIIPICGVIIIFYSIYNIGLELKKNKE